MVHHSADPGQSCQNVTPLQIQSTIAGRVILLQDQARRHLWHVMASTSTQALSLPKKYLSSQSGELRGVTTLQTTNVPYRYLEAYRHASAQPQTIQKQDWQVAKPYHGSTLTAAASNSHRDQEPAAMQRSTSSVRPYTRGRAYGWRTCGRGPCACTEGLARTERLLAA